MGLFSDSRVLFMRFRLGFKEVKRDKGAKFAILGIFVALLYFAISIKSDEEDDNKKTIILFGIFVGSILGSGNRISIIGFFNEKKSKIKNFLLNAGMTKKVYYGYHILFNATVIFAMLYPFVLVFDFMMFGGSEISSFFVCFLGSFSIGFFNMNLAILFTNEVTGLNFISMANFLTSILSGFTVDSSTMGFLMYLSPQNFLVQFFKQKMEKKNGGDNLLGMLWIEVV